MITEGAAAIPLETTRRAFRIQSQTKQRSTLVSGTPYLVNKKQSSTSQKVASVMAFEKFNLNIFYLTNQVIRKFCIYFCSNQLTLP